MPNRVFTDDEGQAFIQPTHHPIFTNIYLLPDTVVSTLVSRPHASPPSQHARISAWSSMRANLAVCSTWPFCGKICGRDESSALWCLVVAGANRPLRLDVATGANIGAPGKAGSCKVQVDLEVELWVAIEVVDK